jgi:hypothetical protein
MHKREGNISTILATVKKFIAGMHRSVGSTNAIPVMGENLLQNQWGGDER